MHQNKRFQKYILKTGLFLGLLFNCFISAVAQCSICTKTASQLGKESATGLNNGIVYLMILPFAIGGYITWRWWKTEKNMES
jgi:hypothetical protein